MALTECDINIGIAPELIALEEMLEKFSTQLSELPAVMDLHVQTLHDFDVACQTPRHLAAVVRADAPQYAVAKIGMEVTRQRLKRRQHLAGGSE